MDDPNFTTEELSSEEWRSVADFDGYEVSSLGRIRSYLTRRPNVLRDKYRILKSLPMKHGYRGVWLYKNNKRHPRSIHSLVLETFVGPRPEGLEGCHGDSCVSNNRLSNLKWATKEANHLDRIAISQLTPLMVTEIRSKYQPFQYTALVLADEYGVSESMIRKVVNRQRRRVL